MSLRNLKKVLLSLIVVGALSSITVHRVYAVFTMESYNNGANISDGTLTMENDVNSSATTCFSLSASTKDNANTNCDQLFKATDVMWPGQVKTVNISIKNTGSLDGRTLEVWMPSCAQQNTPGVPVNNGGNPCAIGGAEFYIQEKTDNTYTTDKQCWWPNTNTTCGAFGSIASFIDPLGNYYVAAPGLRLYNWAVQNPSPALPVGGTSNIRYFTIGMELPPTADNSLQGEAATFPLTWHMDS